MQTEKTSQNNQKVHIYLRNNKKVAYFIPVTQEVSSDYLFALASKLFKLQRDQLALFRSGIQLTAAVNLKLIHKEIIHVVNLTDSLKQQIKIRIVHNKTSRSFTVNSSIRIQQFIEHFLYQELDQEGMKIILIYLGKYLQENKSFREHFIEDEAQISLFYIKQTIIVMQKSIQGHKITNNMIQKLKNTNQMLKSRPKCQQLKIENESGYQQIQKEDQLDWKQQQNNQKIENYEQLFKNQEILSIALSIGLRMKQFYQKFGQLFLKHIKINRIEPIYSETIFQLLKTLTYKLPPMESPVCSRIVKQYYICKDCQDKSNEKIFSFICQECLNQGNHEGHNLRLITNDDQKFAATCDCGKKQYFNSSSFCKKHKGQQQSFFMPQECKADQQLFIKQMQFVFYLFLKLKDISKGYLDQNKKKQIIAIHFVGRIELYQQINFSLISLFYFFGNLSILYTKVEKDVYAWANISMPILLTFLDFVMRKIITINQIVIKEFFDFANSLKTTYLEQNPLQNLSLYLNNGKIILNLLKMRKIQPLTIKQNIQSGANRYRTYFQFYDLYRHLMGTRQQQEIMQFTLQRLSINEFFPRATSKELKINKTAILALDINCMFFFIELMNKLQHYTSKQILLKKIIRQTYFQLKNRQQSVSLSIQRAFTFALFIYFKYSLQNIDKCSENQMLILFEQESTQALVQNIQILINKNMFIAKSDNFSIYNSVLVNRKLQNEQLQFENQKYQKVILSLDSTYIKFLFTILKRLKTSISSDINLIFEQFIKKRQRALTSLYEIFEDNEVSKIEQTIDAILSQICQISNILIQALDSPIAEHILKQCLGRAEQSEVTQIYKLLIYKNKDINSKQFKKCAEETLTHHNQLKKFIKDDFNKVKNQINAHRQLFKNTFNCSFSSYFLNFKSAEESQILYYLKLSKNNRSQISKIVFNENIINLITQSIQWYVRVFQTSMKYNEVSQTNKTISLIIQSLINLHLQTLSRSVKNTIDNILGKSYLMMKVAENIKIKIEIYIRSNKKLEVTIKAIKEQDRSQQLEQQMQAHKKTKKNLKLQQLKNKQKKTLQSLKILGQLTQQNEKTEEKFECIVCKNVSSNQKLNYLCRFRYNNLISQQIFNYNFPIILITTCGHMIHQECLFTNIRTNSLDLFNYSCFLCKSRSNMLMPAMSQYSNQEGKQFLIYMQLIQHLFLQQSRGLVKMHQLYSNIDLPNRMFISCIYIFYGYHLNFQNFFEKNIFPITKIIINFLKSLKIQTSKAKQYFEKIQLNKEHITQVFDKLIDILASTQQDVPQSIQGFVLKQMKQNQNLLLSLPEDLTDLNKLIGKCSKCNKFTSKQVICLLCRLKICQKCNQNNHEHLNKHYGHTAFIQVQNGQCTYSFANFKTNIGCLYLDYFGQQIPNSHYFAAKGQYKLNKQLKSLVDTEILNDEIPYRVVEHTEQTRCIVQ